MNKNFYNLGIFVLISLALGACILLLDQKIARSFAGGFETTDTVRTVNLYKSDVPSLTASSTFALVATGTGPGIATSAAAEAAAGQAAPLKFLFVGDIMLDRNVGARIKKAGLDSLLGGLAAADFFTGYDMVSANLEGAVTDGGRHLAPILSNDFAFAPETVQVLKNYNFNFFNLANNHITDQGPAGLEQTRKNLAELGFNFSGSADAVVDSHSAWIMNIGGQRVGLVGFSMVYHQFDLAAAEKLVADTRAQSDKVIVNIHWGTEYQHEFSQRQATIAHALIDAGADAIVGTHPHVVEGLEIYKNKPIFYSLGNFLFDQYFSADTQEGLAVGIDFNATSSEISLEPLSSRQSVVSLEDAAGSAKFFQKFISWSKVATDTADEIKSGKITIEQADNF